MLAALQTNLNEVRVEWVGRQPAEFGQVHIKMSAAGICGAQLMELAGTKASGPFPHIMGHEGVGYVQSVGHGVSTVKEGDKVVLHWRKGDGIESDFPTYIHDGQKITSGKVVTWAQEVTVSENRATRVPDDAPDELCVLLGCSLSTALGTLEQEAKLKMGESLLIIGAGGLGMSLLHASAYFHPSMVSIVDTHLKDINKPRGIPHGFIVCSPEWNHPGMLQGTYDAVIDTTGNCEALEAAVERLNPSGRLIMVGQPTGAFSIKGGHRLFSGEGITIKATQGGGFQPDKDIHRYLSSKVDFSGIVTHRIALEEINQGIELVKQGNAGRVLIQL